jgi:hypothetical protein
MSKGFRHIVAALVLAACLCSCGREGRVIPRNKLARIYAEMFVADSWLMNYAGAVARFKADTTAFYEPIFEEYGYTVEDYWASVSHYLLDPDRFSRIVKKSNAILTAEVKALEKEREEMLNRPEPRKPGLTKRVFDLYGVDFDGPLVTDRINLMRDSTGRYVPMRILEDTMYLGPRMIVIADTLKTAADSLKTAADSLKTVADTLDAVADTPRDIPVRPRPVRDSASLNRMMAEPLN